MNKLCVDIDTEHLGLAIGIEKPGSYGSLVRSKRLRIGLHTVGWGFYAYSRSWYVGFEFKPGYITLFEDFMQHLGKDTL